MTFGAEFAGTTLVDSTGAVSGAGRAGFEGETIGGDCTGAGILTGEALGWIVAGVLVVEVTGSTTGAALDDFSSLMSAFFCRSFTLSRSFRKLSDLTLKIKHFFERISKICKVLVQLLVRS